MQFSQKYYLYAPFIQIDAYNFKKDSFLYDIADDKVLIFTGNNKKSLVKQERVVYYDYGFVTIDSCVIWGRYASDIIFF